MEESLGEDPLEKENDEEFFDSEEELAEMEEEEIEAFFPPNYPKKEA